MADPFIGEVRILGFDFAPRGWATCDGQLMAISQNTALFSLLGTTYGGDGKTTFALPNLQGRAPMQQGTGTGLSQRTLGEAAGVATVTLLESEMPAHTHALQCQPGPANRSTPVGNTIARADAGTPYAGASPTPPAVAMAAQAITPNGGSQPHNNMQPYLSMNFCIALEGIFPPRG